jgi:hypothetical protein
MPPWIWKSCFWPAVCVCLNVCLASIWMVGQTSFTFSIQHFIHLRLAPSGSECSNYRNRGLSDWLQNKEVIFSAEVQKLQQFWFNFSSLRRPCPFIKTCRWFLQENNGVHYYQTWKVSFLKTGFTDHVDFTVFSKQWWPTEQKFQFSRQCSQD